MPKKPKSDGNPSRRGGLFKKRFGQKNDEFEDFSLDFEFDDIDDDPPSSFASAFSEFDPNHPAIPNIDKYIASLYRKKAEDLPPAGTNLIPECDPTDITSGWWITKSPEEVDVKYENGELAFSCLSNFRLEICRDIRLEKGGKYRLSVEYRGTNTTGVNVKLYFKRVTCNEEIICEKDIYPSDVDFDLTAIDMNIPEAENVRIGLKIDAPPVNGRVRNIVLAELK